jgi:hypothetical protein
MTTTKTRSLATFDAVATDSIVLTDGSIWSHAASLGTYVKGSEFTIDRPLIENFIRVFASGYPRKVPVDYDHSSTNGAAGSGAPVPKAGDVVELRGVFAPEDFTGDLKTSAEKLAQQAGRDLADPQNLGLWMRWKPTNRALGMIKEREYTDLSITFGPVEDKSTGKPQGEVLIAVALTNLPFIDTMLPVAASRGGAQLQDPASGATDAITSQEQKMTTKMLNATGLLAGKAVTNEDEAVVELTALHQELPALRSFSRDVAAEIGETDAAKAVAKVKELKASVADFELKAKTEKAKATKAVVDSTLKELEAKFVPAMRPMLERELTREIGEGKAAKDTETVKALTAAPDLGITTRTTGADDGSSSANTGDDVKIDAKAKELMQSDAEVKAVQERSGFSSAFQLALGKARTQLGLVR